MFYSNNDEICTKYNRLATLLLLLKKVGSTRLRESVIHPISPNTPAPQYQPIDRKKRKGKRVEDNSRDRAASQLKIMVVSRLNSGRSRQQWVRQSSRCCWVSGQIILPRSPEILSIPLCLIFRQVWLPSSLENHRKISRLLYSIWLFRGHDRLRSLQFFRYIFIY